MSIYTFSATDIRGLELSLDTFKDKVLLIVNTASKCGFTPQFAGLEALYSELKDQGLIVLGFPCNQFASQDPGSDGEIEEFCQLNYGVSFPMFAKVDVNGSNAHPLFKHLKKQAKGVLGSEAIKWNFTKFLVNREGEVVARFGSAETPESIAKTIKKYL